MRDKAQGRRQKAEGNRLKVILHPSAFILGCALAGAASGQGSALNRSGSDPTLERDERGMSQLAPEPSRAPGGRLYEAPYEIPQALPLAGGWSYRLATEFGAAADTGTAARLRDYGDARGGLTLNFLNLGLERDATAHYLDFTAGAAGRDDQYYRATFGRYGDFRASLYFSQLPKLFTDQARTVFQGAGSGSLTLVPGLVPGNNTPAQVSAALRSASPFELGFSRKQGGLDFDSTPGADWRLYARYSLEQKKGARPFGGASGYPGVPAVETIEPLDYRTHDLAAGVQWTGAEVHANLGYSGSFFRNAIDTLTWENPLTVGNPAVQQRGRMDLYPDNGYHNLKLDLGAALPLRGRLTGGLSWSRMTQDDNLVAPTVNSGTVGGVNLANWNTTAALGQKSAGARIDTLLAHASATFSPLQDLSLKAWLRRYEENNRTRYVAYNPLTGQYGYLGLDGGASNIVPSGLFRAPVRSIPYESRKDSYGVEGDYRLLRRTGLTLGYERENNRDPYREYGRTAEDRLRAVLGNRDLPWASVRLAFEHARRSGDNYQFDPYRPFYAATALSNAPATLAQLRKYDVADRRQNLVNGRVSFVVAADMDLAVAGRWLDNEYGAAYGRLGERRHGFNLEWSWQPGPKASAWAHYGFERTRLRMATINDDPAGYAGGDPNAGGAVYPLANRWSEESRDDSHSFGAGFRYAFGRATLESGYAYLFSPYRTRYAYASGGALASGTTAGAGDGMPDIVFRQHALETSLRIALDRHSALRLFHRYERSRYEDWHYDGLPLVFAGGAGLFLGAGPRNFSGNLFGVFYQYTPGKRENARP